MISLGSFYFFLASIISIYLEVFMDVAVVVVLTLVDVVVMLVVIVVVMETASQQL